MFKHQMHIKLKVIIPLLFIIGCSSTKDKTGVKPDGRIFRDPEIAAFMEESEVVQEEEESLLLSQSQLDRTRPPWASNKLIPIDSENFIGRIGFGKIGKRNIQTVQDSIERKLKGLIAGDVETRVERIVTDSVSTKIVQYGKQRDEIREHIFTVISRHYTPPITFNGEYDNKFTWIDLTEDSLWIFIRFNKTKYIREKQQRIVKEIEDAGEQAYQYLKKSFRSLAELNNDVEKSLTALGLSSYYISKGGGAAEKEDIFNLGNTEYVKFQRHNLLKEIDKSIKLHLWNKKDQLIVTRDREFKARIVADNAKGYDLNRVKVRIQTDSDYLNYPITAKLESDGSVNIPFFINPAIEDPYGVKVNVLVTFDVISESMPDNQWDKKDDYFDLLKELPSIQFQISIEEFLRIETWVIIHSDIPINFKERSEEIQRSLERELGKYSEYFNVVPYKNWPISYEKVRLYKSGKIDYKEFKKYSGEMQNHNLDIMMEIIPENEETSTLVLVGTNPTGGGNISSMAEGVYSKSLRKGIDQLVKKFVEENFNKQLHLIKPIKSDISIFINGEKKTPSGTLDNTLIFEGLPRFKAQKVVAKSPGYRKQIFNVPGDPFNLYIIPNPISVVSMKQLVLEQGTLHVTVIDSLTGKPVRYGSKGLGKPPIIKLRKRILFFPSPLRYMISDTSSNVSFPISKLGDYHVSVKKDFYTVPFFASTRICKVLDDEDPNSRELNRIKIVLEKSSKSYAQTLSIIPGVGQLYLGKKKQGFSFIVSAVLTSLWGSYQYTQYIDEVEHYNHLNEAYLIADEGNWMAYERDMDRSKVRIKNHKNQAFGAMIMGGIIWGLNLLTVTW